MELRRIASQIESQANEEFGLWNPIWPAPIKVKVQLFNFSNLFHFDSPYFLIFLLKKKKKKSSDQHS